MILLGDKGTNPREEEVVVIGSVTIATILVTSPGNVPVRMKVLMEEEEVEEEGEEVVVDLGITVTLPATIATERDILHENVQREKAEIEVSVVSEVTVMRILFATDAKILDI